MNFIFQVVVVVPFFLIVFLTSPFGVAVAAMLVRPTANRTKLWTHMINTFNLDELLIGVILG